MKVIINSEITEVSEGISLESLLEEKEFADKKGIAVALNSSVIPKSRWQEIILKNNDKVLIISATKGG